MWIEKKGQTFLSWGRVVLLEQIRTHGSIAGAARAMGMGYRHAWELVAQMNELAPRPLVVKVAGGRRGGGARLTNAGELAVARFWRLVGEFRGWLNAQEPGIMTGPGATRRTMGKKPLGRRGRW